MPPDVVVSAPVALGGAACPRASRQNNSNLVRDLVAEALTEVTGREVEDRDMSMNIFNDDSCLENGRPWAAADWGV